MDELSNRRRLPRFACTGTVEMFQDGKLCGWGTVSEISRGGCYIETGNPLPPGSEMQLRLTLESAVLEIAARVAWITPQVGMGMRFEAASPEIENAVVQVLGLVTGDAEIAGAGSAQAEPPAEFLISPIPDLMNEQQAAGPDGVGLGISPEVSPGISPDRISPEAAPGILDKIIQRVSESGALTQQELMEIVRAGR